MRAVPADSGVEFGRSAAVPNPKPTSLYLAGVEYTREQFDAFRIRDVKAVNMDRDEGPPIDKAYISAVGPFADLEACFAAIQISNRTSGRIIRTTQFLVDHTFTIGRLSFFLSFSLFFSRSFNMRYINCTPLWCALG